MRHYRTHWSPPEAVALVFSSQTPSPPNLEIHPRLSGVRRSRKARHRSKFSHKAVDLIFSPLYSRRGSHRFMWMRHHPPARPKRDSLKPLWNNRNGRDPRRVDPLYL